MVTAFYDLLWAWGVVAVVAALLVLLLPAVLRRGVPNLEGLSPQANERLTRCAHYYMWPGTSAGLSAACFYVQVSATVIAIVGAFQGFWWGFAYLVVLVPLMTGVGYRYNPTLFFNAESEKALHEEITAFLAAETRKRRTAA